MTESTNSSKWSVAVQAWDQFVRQHPELGYRHGAWPFHNFLRLFRDELVAADAIRLAKKKHWIANSMVFPQVAFECATGMRAIRGDSVGTRELVASLTLRNGGHA